MLNPYLLVAALVGFAVAGWIGYDVGVSMERGRGALAMQTAIVAAAEAARADVAAESARRKEAALHDARASAASREARLKGQLNALQTDRPDCRWPADRRLHLNAAVAAANVDAGADPAAGVHDALPVPAEPER